MSPSVITIGNFDGVHLGHRALIARCAQIAREQQARVVAITFDPSPAQVLGPGPSPAKLMDLPTRLATIRAAGADEVVVLRPDRALLSLSAESFVLERLLPMHPVAIVEGADFHFGKGRAGDVAVLSTLGQSHGFVAEVVPAATAVLENLHIVTVSSTFIRWLLKMGRVTDAAACLGGWFALGGEVCHGDQKGRTLNVPTANVDPSKSPDLALPGDGVYAAVATLADGSSHAAAVSIGIKPTFAGKARLVEAHLLDFQGDLYGQTIRLSFRRWLREQMHFPSVTTLKEQLQRDIALARRMQSQGILADDAPWPGATQRARAV
jgi:riboflavin kinase/FMN adenylyltransferase